jgi:dolichyl-phosphate-mannose-protein mannosyltransferase
VKSWTIATAIGVGIGAIYVLSPLTVWFAVAMWALHRYATSGLDADERRWITALLAVAVVIRVAAVAGLFVVTNHSKVPFGIFFGDEEFYIRRSIWLRNVALNIPIHSADLIYAFDDSGWTSHLYVLSFLEALVGPAPYGVHLSGIALYMFAAVSVFRMARRSFGKVAAFLAFTLLCFLPSLFAWSISVLKEPLYFLLTTCSILLALAAARAPRWAWRIAAVVLLIATLAALNTVREGGGVLAGAGIAIGVAGAWIVRRPIAVAALVVALPIVSGALLRDPARQIRVYSYVQRAAKQHWGHVQTTGWTYKLLDEHYYGDSSSIDGLEFRDAAIFVVRAFERYVTAPWPWEAESTAAVTYLPEQIVWYVVIALLPFGIVSCLRRDPLLACLLLGVGVVAMAGIALSSGNVGTLVRLRVLAWPYFATLSAAGLCDLLAAAVRHKRGPAIEKAELIWP